MVNGGGTVPTSTGATSNPPAGTGSCKVTYQTSTWSGGFTANVTMNNTGSSAMNGWSLAFSLPSGQAITNSWNATLSGNSGSVTATNVAYNGSIPVGGSQSFGFQGTYSGTFAKPSSFSLNGTSCTVA